MRTLRHAAAVLNGLIIRSGYTSLRKYASTVPLMTCLAGVVGGCTGSGKASTDREPARPDSSDTAAVTMTEFVCSDYPQLPDTWASGCDPGLDDCADGMVCVVQATAPVLAETCQIPCAGLDDCGTFCATKYIPEGVPVNTECRLELAIPYCDNPEMF